MQAASRAASSAQRAVAPGGSRARGAIGALGVAAVLAGALTAAGGTAQAAPATAGAPVPMVAVTPAGPLPAPSACTGTGTVSCHLYAVAGSVNLPGLANPSPVWKFRDSATLPAPGALTGTGPTLVVNAGDRVTITLDNVNVPDVVALAVPGLAGFTPDTSGVPVGGAARSYTFTAGRPGTYLYEAGRTGSGTTWDDGSRQTLMGLAGALVVRPADFATQTTDLGVGSHPASAFHDEAVLVLGDYDPAFAAAPTTFDLRDFNPTYRTINGKVYPDTDQIPTATGHAVLLRYLNAGLTDHSVGVQGLRQRLIARTTFPAAEMSVVGDMLAPGQTEDVAVDLHSEGNWVVGDLSGHLDSAGLKAGPGAGAQLAFGGMMTVLGTTVTASTTDQVGPTSAITSMVPNPAKVTDNPVTVSASFTDPTGNGGPNAVAAAEVLIDGELTTLTPGTGHAMTLTPGATTGTATGTLNISSLLAGLNQGNHTVFVRAQDAAGNWGDPTSAVLTLSVTGATTSSVSVKPSPTNGSAAVTVTATGDDTALGGTVMGGRFTVDCDPTSTTTTCTYTSMSIGAQNAAVASLTGTLPSTSVPVTEGNHTVSVQTQDSAGLWGPPATVSLVVDKTAPTASGLAVNPPTNNGTQADPADPTSFKVSGTFTDVVTGKPASNIVAAEGYFPPITATSGPTQATGPTIADNGKGFVFSAGDGAFNSPTEAASGLIPLSALTAYPDGTYRIWAHAKDAAGNWSVWTAVSFTVQRGLFADGFESGNTAAWTGAGAGTAAQKPVNSAAASAGTYGLQVGGTANLNTASVYVTTPTISPAASQYHARFAFRPISLRTGNSATSQTGIFTGLSAATTRFQVQYHRANGNNAPAQVRLVLRRADSSTATTAWVTVSTGSFSSIQVDWIAGTNATATLTVNGVATSLTNQNTSGTTISSAQLGVRDTLTGSSVSGAAYFDAFVSSLTPLP